GVFVDPPCASRVRSNDGMNIFWQAPLYLLQIFQDTRPRPIEIGAILEDNEDVGIAKHGLRSHCFDLGSSQKSRDNGIGDLIFDKIRWLPCPRRVDGYFHVGNIRQCIKRNTAQCPDAREQKQEYSRENEETVSRTQVNPSGDHVTSLPWRLCSIACWR